MANLSREIQLLLESTVSSGHASLLDEAEVTTSVAKTQQDNLKSLLDTVSLVAQDMLKKICATSEISSGDPILDPTKPSLSLMCITSAMIGLLQKPAKEASNETSESFPSEQNEPAKKDSGETDSPDSDILSQHQKQFQVVFKDISDMANKKMKDMCKSNEIESDDPLLDPRSSALAFTTLFSAITEVEGNSAATSEDYFLGTSLSPAEKTLETLLFSLYEKEDESLPWDDGERAVKKEIDRRFKGDRQAIKGYLIRVYKHLKDDYKIKILKKVLDLYKRELAKEEPSKEQGGSQEVKPSKGAESDSDAPEKQSFLKRHPYLSGYLGGNALGLPFTLASASTGFVLPGPVAAGGIASGVAASAGAAAGTAAAIGTAVTTMGVGAMVAGTAIGLRGMYKAGKMYGNIDTNAGGEKVGQIRKFARKHPLITGLLTSPVTLGGGLVIGGMYALGKRAGKKAEVTKALG